MSAEMPAIDRTGDGGDTGNTRNALVVGYDGSAGAERALELAADLSDRLSASLTIARSWRPTPNPSAVVQLTEQPHSTAEDAAIASEELMRDCSAVVNKHPNLVVHYTVDAASPADLLCQISQDARMLVVGSRGLGGLAGMMLGSVSSRCLHQSASPVLVVPQRELRPAIRQRPTRTFPPDVGITPSVAEGSIVVGYDGSPHALRALREALRLAGQLSVPVAIIQTWSFDTAPEGSRWKDGYAASYPEIAHEVLLQLEQATKPITAARPQVAAQCFAVLGYPAEVLVRASESAAMMIVGSRGRGGFAGLLLGSISTQCAHRALCPVLVVR